MWDEVTSLDADNLGWTKTYVKTLETRISEEAAAEAPDEEILTYLRQELRNYQGLLERVSGDVS